jgi:Dolichyl-phosphate-mannose-protein mannosyltransferase
VRRRLANAFAWRERLIEQRMRMVVVFAAALVVYALQAIGWPLRIGRDLDEYLFAYVQLFDHDVLLPWSGLFRTPVTPVVAGTTLDAGGAALAEFVMAIVFAGSIVAWTAAARAFGPRAALATAVALLLYPGYGGMFHELASDSLFAAAFALWALLLTRAMRAPSIGRFAAVGLAVALVALVRPGGVVLLLVAPVALVVGAPWRRRLAWVGVIALAAVVPLAGWTVHNGLRYDTWALARGGNAVVPFYRALLTDRIVAPGNGPASEKLARAIQQHLLTRDPYRSYGITLDDVFQRATTRVHEDMYLLSDEQFGWDSSYTVLRKAAIEGIRKHPGLYARGVATTMGQELNRVYYRLESGKGNERAADDGETVDVDGKSLPKPSENQLIPGGQNLWISRPDNAIREVWTSPTEQTFSFADPALVQRFDAVVAEMNDLLGKLPARSGNEQVARRLSQASRWYPRPWMWLLVGAVALVLRRPRRSAVLVAVAIGAALSMGINALGLPTDLHFVVPVAPAFVLFALGAGLGPRGERAPNAVGDGAVAPDGHPRDQRLRAARTPD